MNVIVCTPEELRAIVAAAVAEALAAQRPPAAPPSEWLDAAEAAAHVGCHPKTLRRLGAPSHRVGRLVRYQRGELEAWVARRKAPVPEVAAPPVAREVGRRSESRVLAGPWPPRAPGT